MPEIKQTLLDDEIVRIYKEIILYFEKEVAPNPKGFRKNDARFSGFLKLLQADFQCVDSSSAITIPNSYKLKKESFFIIKPVIRNGQKFSLLASLLSHLRNSFCHGHFSKEKVGKRTTMLCLEDYYTKGHKIGQLSMVAQIPLSQFQPLIQIIKLCRK